jgi:general L-amino acid transport system permease protein
MANSVHRIHLPSEARWHGWLWQAALATAAVALAWYLVGNTAANLARRHIPFGFDFLSRPAGFEFYFKLLHWTTTDTYGRAALVACVNTLFVAALAVATATGLGLTLGIMRLSANWLARTISLVIVELVKNTPQLVQIFFIYVGVLQALPPTRQSLHLGAAILLNVRGLFVPAPIAGETAFAAVAGLVLALAVAIALARLRLRLAGARRRALGIASWALPAAALGFASAGGAVAGWDVPVLRGLNVQGGWALRPELLALWLGLSLYSGAFIAEIVRAAILGVDRGQIEAAMSLGLTRRQALRLVVLPQALRLIVPPLTSQYLNIIKSTSLGAAIAYPEIFLIITGTTLTQTGQAIETMAIVMLVFLAINLAASGFMNWYNRAVALRGR